MDEIDYFELLEKIKSAPSENFESETMEFKEFKDANALHNSKDLSDEVVAFANSLGGHIIVGVRDSSNIKNKEWPSQLVGFPISDSIEIRERIIGRTTPRLQIKVQSFTYEDKNYISISVPRHRGGLVSTTSGKIYTRDGRSSRPMSPLEIEAAVKSLPNYDWSAEELGLDVSTALDDIQVELAKSFYSGQKKLKSIPTGNFLEAIGATKDGVLTKGGLLLLGKRSQIEKNIGLFEFRFSWKTKSNDLEINDVWDGCLWEAIQRARGHFDSCNSFSEFEWKGIKHLVPILDAIAFHEAFLNAVAHRDYSQEGMVSVDYHSTKMIITSPGGFYGGVNKDNIFKHQPRHRNKALARMLMAFNLVDRAGMGIKRISQRSLMYGRKFPRFTEANGCVEVSMDAEYMTAPIFVLAQSPPAKSVIDLAIINSIFEKEHVTLADLEQKIYFITDEPWAEICRLVEDARYCEFRGQRDGIYVRATKAYASLLRVPKQGRTSRVSDKLVLLYKHLRAHGSSSNADLSRILGYAHSSQTSQFLRLTAFVSREGEGPAAIWKLC